MRERLAVLALCVVLILGCLGLSGWLIFSGEAPGVEGIFLAFTALVLALSCAAAIWFMLQPPPPGKTGSGKAAAAPEGT